MNMVQVQEAMAELEVKEETPLVDATIWSHLSVDDIADPEQLVRTGVLIPTVEGQIPYRTKNGQEYNYLLLKDRRIGYLKSGVLQSVNSTYTTLQANVHGAAGNLIGLTVDELHEDIDKRLGACQELYGITLNKSAMTAKKIEIQKTFCLDDDYRLYRRPLNQIFYRLPKKSKLKNQFNFEEVIDATVNKHTYCAMSRQGKHSDNYIKLQVYNKGRQLEDELKMPLPKTVIRVEIVLIGASKIKSELGTNKFDELTGELISNYYHQKIKYLIIDAWEKEDKARRKQLMKIIRELRGQNSKNWVSGTLRKVLNEEVVSGGIPAILDVEEICEVIKQMPEIKHKKRVQDIFRGQAVQYESSFVQGDHKRLHELLDKIGMSAIDVPETGQVVATKKDEEKSYLVKDNKR